MSRLNKLEVRRLARRWGTEAPSTSGGSSTWGDITGTLTAQVDLQAALDAKVNLTGGNSITGDQSITGNLNVDGAYTSSLGASVVIQNASDDYTNIQFNLSTGGPVGVIFGGLSSDHSMYLDCDHIVLEDLSDAHVYIDATATKVDIKAVNVTKLSVISTGVQLFGLANAANDAAAATAGVPVNGLYRNGSVLMIRVV